MRKIGILVFIIVSILALTGCNRQYFDTQYTFKKAIVYLGNEKMELDIRSWKDYEGEQLQIKTIDGTTYLVSMNNTILVSE